MHWIDYLKSRNQIDFNLTLSNVMAIPTDKHTKVINSNWFTKNKSMGIILKEDLKGLPNVIFKRQALAKIHKINVSISLKI